MTAGDASTRGLDQDVALIRELAEYIGIEAPTVDVFMHGTTNTLAALDRLEACIAEVEQQRDDALGERVIAQLDIAQARAEAAEARIAELERERDADRNGLEAAVVKIHFHDGERAACELALTVAERRVEALTAALREIEALTPFRPPTEPSGIGNGPAIARAALADEEPYADVPGAGQRGCG